MDIDRITHCLERLERDLALANRLKIAELKISLRKLTAADVPALEREQDEIDAERTGRYAAPVPWSQDA